VWRQLPLEVLNEARKQVSSGQPLFGWPLAGRPSPDDEERASQQVAEAAEHCIRTLLGPEHVPCAPEPFKGLLKSCQQMKLDDDDDDDDGWDCLGSIAELL